MWAQHLRHLYSRGEQNTSHWALTNHSGGVCLESRRGRSWKEMKWAWGWEGIPVSKPRQPELYCILLLHKKKDKEKVAACANVQTLHTLSLFFRAPSVDTFNSLTQKLKFIIFHTLLYWAAMNVLQNVVCWTGGLNQVFQNRQPKWDANGPEFGVWEPLEAWCR